MPRNAARMGTQKRHGCLSCDTSFNFVLIDINVFPVKFIALFLPSLRTLLQSVNLSSRCELPCYFIYPLGMERNMPFDLLNTRERILIRPHRVDGLLSASGNAVISAIAFV